VVEVVVRRDSARERHLVVLDDPPNAIDVPARVHHETLPGRVVADHVHEVSHRDGGAEDLLFHDVARRVAREAHVAAGQELPEVEPRRRGLFRQFQAVAHDRVVRLQR